VVVRKNVKASVLPNQINLLPLATKKPNGPRTRVPLSPPSSRKAMTTATAWTSQPPPSGGAARNLKLPPPPLPLLQSLSQVALGVHPRGQREGQELLRRARLRHSNRHHLPGKALASNRSEHINK